VETAALIMSVTALTIVAYQIGAQVSNWKYQKLMSSLAEQLRKDQDDFFIRMWNLIANPDTPSSDNWKWKEAKEMYVKDLESFVFDSESGTLSVNGNEIENVTGFSLTCKEGVFELEVTEAFISSHLHNSKINLIKR
jgi:archaellum component FlaG (FlaF/FlaG flagellin family)